MSRMRREQMKQCLSARFRKVITLTWKRQTTLVPNHRIVPRVERLARNLKRHIFSAENVASDAQRASRQLIKGMSLQQE